MPATVGQARPEAIPKPHSPTPWHPVTRVAFRFCFCYFTLFCLLFPQILFVFTGVLGRLLPDYAVLWQMIAVDPATRSLGRWIFGVDTSLHADSGSGDQPATWMLVFCLLVISAVVTALWSLLDRHRDSYHRLFSWFLVFLRLCLGGQMLFYGLAKVIPTQMPEPPLSALLQPFGDFSPLSVLWLQVGSSPVYEMLLGSVEVAAGLLLFIPRTATLGALLSLASATQIFLLNMTFDVPVKILSFHLLVASAVVLLPQAGRLANVLVLARPAQPATQPLLFADSRRNRVAAVAQMVIGLWVLTGLIQASWMAWHEFGGGQARPELYGIWSVTEFNRAGKPVAPLTTDENRWQRLVFDSQSAATVQRMDGELVSVQATVDPADKELTLTAPTDPGLLARFHYHRPAPEDLVLDGSVGGQPVTIALRLVDPDSFTLNNRGFHWVQDYPYFR